MNRPREQRGLHGHGQEGLGPIAHGGGRIDIERAADAGVRLDPAVYTNTSEMSVVVWAQ